MRLSIHIPSENSVDHIPANISSLKKIKDLTDLERKLCFVDYFEYMFVSIPLFMGL